MTFYTNDGYAFIPQSINDVDDSTWAGTWSNLKTSFEHALKEGPVGSYYRILQSYETIYDNDSPVVSKENADTLLKEYRVNNITIPKEGVTQSYLDLVVAQTKAKAEREQIYQRTSHGAINSSLSFTASLAGSMLDPTNIGLMFLPVVGQARAGTLLGRTGQRFLQGALMGGAQSIAFQPFTTQAASMEGEDYTNMQALTNIALGTLAGGAIPSLFGAVGEGIGRIRAYRASKKTKLESDLSTNNIADELIDNKTTVSATNEPSFDYNYHAQLADDLAFDEVINSHILELEHNSLYQLSGAEQKSIQKELNDINYQLKPEVQEAKFRELAESYHSNTVSGRQAKKLAKKEVEALRQDLEIRRTELQDQLDAHKKANQSIYDLNVIRKGNIPERLKADYELRKQEIHNRIKDFDIPEQTAIERINDADPLIRDNALRASIAQAHAGKLLDVEPFFNLNDPNKKADAIKKLSGLDNDIDHAAIKSSEQADIELKQSFNKTDYEKVVDDFNYQHELIAAKAEQHSPESKAIIDEAVRYANDDTTSKAAKAFAMCRIGL